MTQGNQQRSVLAGGGNRAAAFLLDVILLVFLMGLFSESLGDLRQFVLPLIALGYVAAMPLPPNCSIGLATGLVVPRLVARARFHGRQHMYQPRCVASSGEYASHQFFLADVALAHMLNFDARSGSANRG